MPLGGLLPYSQDDNEQTRRSMEALLAPHARQRLERLLGTQPPEALNLPGHLEPPGDIEGLARTGVLGRPDRFKLLLQLLQSLPAQSGPVIEAQLTSRR